MVGAPSFMLYVYMMDKSMGFVFETTYEGLNPNATAEGGINITPGKQPGKVTQNNSIITAETMKDVSSVLAQSVDALKSLCQQEEPQKQTNDDFNLGRKIQLQTSRRAMLDDIRKVREDTGRCKRKIVKWEKS